MTRIRFLHLFSLLMAVQLAMAQNAMQRYEYWMDNDYQSRTVVPSSQDDISFEVDCKHLTPGLHHLNVRGQTESGVWGGLSRYLVYLAESGKGAASMTAYEYWLDNDYEGRTVKENSTLPDAITMDVSLLSPGIHYFNYRAKSSSGQWGGLTRILVYLAENRKGDEGVTEYEYWLDNDYQSRTNVKSVIPGNALTIDVTDLKPGVHYFNFRAKSSSGQWGGLIRHMAYIFDQTAKSQKVEKLEYWIDEAFEQRVTQQVEADSTVITVDLSDMELGTHTFNFYGVTDSGEKCMLSSYSFSVDALPIVPTPTITREGNTITIIDGEGAETKYPIEYRYTLDGTKPTKTSTLYEGPYDVLRNDTLKVIGYQYAHDPSKMVTLVVDWFKVATPHFAQVGNTLTITTDTTHAALYYKIGNGEEQLYETPIRLADQSRVTAVGRLDGFHDSEAAVYSPRVVKAAKPVVSYNGRYLEIRKNDANADDQVTIYYTLDGTSPVNGLDVAEDIMKYENKLTIDQLCQVRVVASVDTLNVSDETKFSVDYLYNDQTQTASVRRAGLLGNAFTWCGTGDIQRLSVVGPLNDTDLSTLRSMPALAHLNLLEATMGGGQLPGNAFEGMPLLSFVSPQTLSSAGGQLFKDCQQLAAVVWKSPVALRANSFDGVNNPNLLLYVDNASLNLTSVPNVVENGVAQTITLSDVSSGNGNFYCPLAFTAENISYAHDYQQETAIGVTQGWETLTLPFTVQNVKHESGRTLLPFGADGEGYPFWLMALESDGLKNTQTIEANKPYVIAMPNNPGVYADEYNQNGRVTFAASHTEVPVTEPQTVTDNRGHTLVPTYQQIGKSAGVFALNVGDSRDGWLPGSTFLADYRDVRPFEVYMPQSPASSRRAVALHDLMDNVPSGIIDMTAADGMSALVKVYNLSGFLVTIGRRDEVMKHLAKGVYIVNGRKVVVK